MLQFSGGVNPAAYRYNDQLSMGRHSLIGPSRRAVPFAGLGLTEFTARRVLVGWSCLIAAVVAGGAAACGPTNDSPDPITSGHAVVAELSNTTIGSPKTTPTTYWIVQRDALTACPDFLYFVRRYSARRPQFEQCARSGFAERGCEDAT